MLLRDSKNKGDASYGEARQLAQKSLGRDFEGYRRDFLAMIDQAERIGGSSVAAK